MAEITADLIKRLRENTGAGMMDCKKALSEMKGEFDDAVDWLRKKGLAAAQKKAGRVAAEGLVAVVVEGGRGAVVEVNSETDFVARNDKFQGFVAAVAKLAVQSKDLPDLIAKPMPGEGKTAADRLTDLVATIGENMSLRRMATLSAGAGVVASYVHGALAPGLGKIGVLVALESTGNKEKLAALGKQIAMHVAAANPQALSIEAVDAAVVERERAVLTDKAKASGRPEAVIGKMVEGGLRKFFEDVALLEQTYVIDNESKIKDVIAKAAKEVGAPVKVAGFVRMALGEGIERAKE
ncbi:MAG TPA: translation elongation factor Ts [Candidatus Angelobacter sp.]|nr:translation elongation factor Ts [Candidatus Angelobacter sp.]